jgi:propanol-preferring alcohol dehydrogenase
MRAMMLRYEWKPLIMAEVQRPVPGPEQILLEVHACGICRTDLHIIDGELPNPKLPLIPGHEIAGRVVRTGVRVEGVHPGDRVGVPWLGRTDGTCRYCRSGKEEPVRQSGIHGLYKRRRLRRICGSIKNPLGVFRGMR